MPRYRADECSTYFCTITVLDWLPIFIEEAYCRILLDSLTYCRLYKALELYAYVVMPNHLHLLASAVIQEGQPVLHEVIRDFKRFTSRQVHDRLRTDGRVTCLEWLRKATEPPRQARGELGLWQDSFHPQEVYTAEVFEQKLRYLHENPVRKGLVLLPDHWWFGSARNHAGEDPVAMQIDRWPGY